MRQNQKPRAPACLLDPSGAFSPRAAAARLHRLRARAAGACTAAVCCDPISAGAAGGELVGKYLLSEERSFARSIATAPPKRYLVNACNFFGGRLPPS